MARNSLVIKNKTACVVGSRTLTAQDVYRIGVIGNMLAALGFTGRSGNALGSDREWDEYLFVQHILPWNGYNGNYHGENDYQYLALEECPHQLMSDAIRIMEEHHPYGATLKKGAHKMHTRNVFQPLGTALHPDTYADLTIYTADETPAGKVSGGTSSAVEISRSYKIPTFNLRKDEDFNALCAILEEALEHTVDVS